MTDARPHKTPGPDHPITMERSSAQVVVRCGSAVIAETDRALEMREASYPPVLYIPLEDVHQDLLRPSDHHTCCPYKGEASYYDVSTGTEPIWPPRSGTTTTPFQPSRKSRAMWPSTPIG